MTTHKIKSGSPATSTIAAEPLPPRPLPLARRLILATICCAGVAWLVGPVGRLLVVLPLLLFGPGYLLERLLRPFPRQGSSSLQISNVTNLSQTIFLLPALWLGLSLSIVALIYEWATLLGIALTPAVLGLLATSCGFGVILRMWRETAITASPAHPISASLHHRIAPAALLLIFALTLWTRFSQIRDLALPSWVDSVHHALLIRVAAERGQAPLALAPYMPVDQLPYHWGYHVFVAAAMRLSGLALPQAMLWSGQVLNGLHVLAAAGLAAYLWRRPIAGVVAALVVGLLSIFPAYYVSWGRYTQLTGLLLLPPLMASWLALLRAPSWRLAIVLALLLAGLSLIHFVVLAFALCFMLVSGLAWVCGESRIALRARFVHAAGSAALALALAGPWLWILAARALLPSNVGQSRPLVGDGSYFWLDQSLLWAGQNRPLIALALAAALWGVRGHRRVAAEQIIWVGVLLMLANPALALYVLPLAGLALLVWSLACRRIVPAIVGVGLLLLNPLVVARPPHLTLVSMESVVISLFIPIGVLVGGGAALLWERLAWRQDKETGDRRQETGDRRQETGDRRQETGDKERSVSQSPISRSLVSGLTVCLSQITLARLHSRESPLASRWSG